jgi:hypothetical protein
MVCQTFRSQKWSDRSEVGYVIFAELDRCIEDCVLIPGNIERLLGLPDYRSGSSMTYILNRVGGQFRVLIVSFESGRASRVDTAIYFE